ncbi:hypothetical protein D3C87_860150 [compost metagenome]
MSELPTNPVDESEMDDAVIDLRQASFGKGTKIKVQLKKVKELSLIKTDKFKAGKAYRVKAEPEQAFFINAIGFHPMSALPTGFGFVVDQTGYKEAYFYLHDLGGEVFF